ncbi:n-acetylglutamate synthase [Syntrophotalea acetylenica]|uniref:N-acetylglutamate synthase n=1 Tax=Syntrophotalea acetylenica TaxID=29542 RepID=A0A1L3GEM0_SYNAC|nr:n-acetylglutamate synthase [Syntrophotalea acetylenica]APG24357.1 n-acetylglutamate synthase [Syntrophotalea acetylenica]APG44938.1 n-acetylglutamate synthase [Syntrophotalea acetylenica]
MRDINYNDRLFRSVENSDTGEVDQSTIFHYHQKEDVVWASYEGGSIRFGTLIAKVQPDGCLDMRYSHINQHGQIMTGNCWSQPEVLADGRLRLVENWQWTCGDYTKGHSTIEEVLR